MIVSIRCVRSDIINIIIVFLSTFFFYNYIQNIPVLYIVVLIFFFFTYLYSLPIPYYYKDIIIIFNDGAFKYFHVEFTCFKVKIIYVEFTLRQ